MHSIRFQVTKYPFKFLPLLNSLHKKYDLLHSACYYATNDVDSFTNDLVERFRTKQRIAHDATSFRQLFDSTKSNQDITNMTLDEINDFITYLITRNRDRNLELVISECLKLRKFIGESSLKKLFRHYSACGKTEMILVLQSYCLNIDRNVYRRNGEYEHYLAKAQCFKGNTDRGLSLLKHCYKRNENLRSVYRVILRELIQDTVMNRSEASLVILKKYVLEFSEVFKDQYPLICFWHICWSSTWFSDQQLANELLDGSEGLKEIIQERATAFSITILREEYNEDAVTRLLQALLKYEMMDEYVKVLQVLFNYKMKNRDIRGCSEIMKNCEVLGVNLPAVSQGRYIRMIIQGKPQDNKQPEKPYSKNFRLKF